jgi:hypothetical protein
MRLRSNIFVTIARTALTLRRSSLINGFIRLASVFSSNKILSRLKFVEVHWHSSFAPASLHVTALASRARPLFKQFQTLYLMCPGC